MERQGLLQQGDKIYKCSEIEINLKKKAKRVK